MSGRVVPEFLRQRFLRTVVSIEIDGTWLEAADAIDALATPVHVITAFNPDGRRLSRADNDSRNADLYDQLMAEGLDVHPAVGRSADGDWAEDSWAVLGIGPKRARRLGRDWGQDAVFELTDDQQRVIGCGGRWIRSRPLAEGIADDDGLDLADAVLDSLGVEVQPDFLRAFEHGWRDDGDLGLPCPECGGELHLFGADLRSKSGVLYRAMAFVCPAEATVRLPNEVQASYRSVARAWRSWTLAKADADEQGLIERSYWAYVIELSDDVGDREGNELPWVYVGQTSGTPAERFAKHLSGDKASRWVRKYGLHLRPDLYQDQPCLRSQAESLAYEAWLFAYLQAIGFPAKGGT